MRNELETNFRERKTLLSFYHLTNVENKGKCTCSSECQIQRIDAQTKRITRNLLMRSKRAQLKLEMRGIFVIFLFYFRLKVSVISIHLRTQ